MGRTRARAGTRNVTGYRKRCNTSEDHNLLSNITYNMQETIWQLQRGAVPCEEAGACCPVLLLGALHLLHRQRTGLPKETSDPERDCEIQTWNTIADGVALKWRQTRHQHSKDLGEDLSVPGATSRNPWTPRNDHEKRCDETIQMLLRDGVVLQTCCSLQRDERRQMMFTLCCVFSRNAKLTMIVSSNRFRLSAPPGKQIRRTKVKFHLWLIRQESRIFELVTKLRILNFFVTCSEHL